MARHMEKKGEGERSPKIMVNIPKPMKQKEERVRERWDLQYLGHTHRHSDIVNP